jgi:NMD protein affecting ribosome stability and mRNA decay
MLICAVCGSSNKKISSRRGICIDCYIKDGLIDHIKPIKLTVCPRCYRIKKQRWIRFPSFEELEGFLEEDFKNKIVTKGSVFIDDIQVSLSPNLREAKVTLDLYLEDYGEITEINLDLPIILNKTLCESCLRFKTENYEALIQLRTTNSRMVSEFESLLEAMDHEDIETLIKKVRFSYGIDAYFTSLRVAKKVANEFRKKYGCKYKETKSMVSGMKYRYTLLLDMR